MLNPLCINESLQRRALAALLLLLTTVSAGMAQAQGDALPLPTELRDRLLQPLPPGESPRRWDELRKLYTEEHFRPIWLGPQGPNRRALQLTGRLTRAYQEGLDPERYDTETIAALWASRDPAELIRLELLLSQAFFDYARDVRSGLLEPGQAASLWKIGKVEVDVVTMLRLSMLADDFRTALDALPPVHPGYQRLRQALARYRQIEAEGGWPVIPDGPTLQEGMSDSRVLALRRRLALVGDLSLPGTLEDKRFDEALTYAVQRFQVRHGLMVDGAVGRSTLAALNVPVAQRIEQIIINMERWRWLPQYLGRRHIIVNIPAYKLVAYDSAEAQLSMPVIIGTRERPTPATWGMLHSIVFNPYWTVPRNIALRDVIPRQRKNPDYMPSYNIRVFKGWNGGEELDPRSIDWKAVNWNNFPYTLRQDPGPKNPLGKAKFLFNNHFNVYLHDTPHDELFAQSVRAYSSGCIRLEEPLRLADFVLAGEKGWAWNDTMVRAVIDSQMTYELPLAYPIPVYLLYLTAWVGEDGAVNFRRDIYGEDAMLRPMMHAAEPGR